MPETTDRITALSTLQFASGGLFDAEPVDDYTVHLVRSNERGGTPGPTLCGIDRFHPDSAGWSVGGGISGPTIVHKPCPGCAEVARREFAGLPVGGLGAAEMTAVLTVLCKHKRCRKPIVRCETLPAHCGCSSAYGWIHANEGAHACEPRADGPYAQPESTGE